MADTDLLTLAEVEDKLGVTGEADLALLQSYITAASAVIVRKCGPVVREAGQDDFPITEYFDGTGTATVWVRRPPAYEVTAVAELVGDTWQLATTWATYPDGRVVRVDAANCDVPFAVGRLNVGVSYHPGRVLTTADVPAHFKQACFMIVRQLWVREQAMGTATYGQPDVWVPTYAVPNAVDELLAGELLPVPVA